MLTERQKSACRIGLTAGVALAAAVFLATIAGRGALENTTYRTVIVVISKASSAALAESGEDRAAAFVARSLRLFDLRSSIDTDRRAAAGPRGELGGDRIASQAFTVRTHDLSKLYALNRELERGSRWPVTDLSRTSQFVQTTSAGNVRLWRLRSADADRGVTLQINGPSAAFGYADALMLAFFCAAVISFGATEANRRDPFSYPPGLHPWAIASQIVTAALLACWALVYLVFLQRRPDIGFTCISLLVAASLVRWVWVVARSPELRRHG